MWVGWSYTLSSGRDRTLTRRAARALETLSSFSNQPTAVLATIYDEFAASTPEGNLIRIFDARGRMVYPRISSAPPDFPWPKLNATPADIYRNLKYRGREYRILQHPANLGTAKMLVVVGGQLEDNRQMLARFTTGLVETIPLLLRCV